MSSIIFAAVNFLSIMGIASGFESENGIEWSRIASTSGVNLGFLPHHDVKYAVELQVPSKVFPAGKLEMAFVANTSNSIDKQSAGIDDFKLTVQYDCSARRILENSHGFGISNLQTISEPMPGADATPSEPKLDHHDGPHCSATDFPCDGGTKAFICHYSVFKGYSTYCVSEEDTDVIHFYPNDYCGSCVGGYGGGNANS